MNSKADLHQTEWEIRQETSWFHWQLTGIWTFRHLLIRLVRRDLLIHHQQTILGPLWIIFQPLIILFIYVLIFDQAVGLSTDGLPPALFYLSGIILWTLYSECFTGTAFTFIQNGTLFAKVYFPRLIIPLSVVLLNYIRFGVQFLLFLILLLFLRPQVLATQPVLVIVSLLLSSVVTAGLGLGMGMMFSIMTAKYRDLVNVIHLIVRLLMFATPIIYPLSAVGPEVRKWIMLNPLSSMFEFFRVGFLGQGTVSALQIVYSVACMLIVVVAGSMMFNKFSNKLQDVI